MIAVLIGDVHTIRGRRDEAIALLRETQQRALSQPGCLVYRFAEVVGDPDHFVVHEEWRDAAALEAHYGSLARVDCQARIGELLVRPTEVRVHRVAETMRPIDSGPMDPRMAD